MSQFTASTPGIGATSMQLIPRMIFIMDLKEGDLSPIPRMIDGSQARDPDNTITSVELRPGLLLGKITSTASGAVTVPTIGLYGASVMGALTGAITNATTQTAGTVTLAQGTEIIRRLGSSGTLVITGSPTATGVVVSNTIVYSAIALGASTAVITWTAPSTAYVAGSWLGANDGSAVPTTVLEGGGYNTRATDGFTGSNILAQNPRVPITCKPFFTTNIINYPASANTGLISYLKTKIRTIVPGAMFDDDL